LKKLLLILALSCSYAFADDPESAPANQYEMLGTASKPLINGVPYDGSTPFLEPNQGSVVAKSANTSASDDVVKITNKSVNPVKSNFKSDTWATDERVEKALHQAAGDGKLSYVLGQAKQRNLPASVAIVPIVESNYNANAVSPKGAGGAWQIMPKTAQGYGMESKDRFDFNNSTKLALEILTDLHEQFGNWALAFAAYNCGSQCVINALKKNPTATDINDLSLPSETKNYVNQIMHLNTVIAGLKINDNKN
jgi:Transglycosylase SLT domain